QTPWSADVREAVSELAQRPAAPAEKGKRLRASRHCRTVLPALRRPAFELPPATPASLSPPPTTSRAGAWGAWHPSVWGSGRAKDKGGGGRGSAGPAERGHLAEAQLLPAAPRRAAPREPRAPVPARARELAQTGGLPPPPLTAETCQDLEAAEHNSPPLSSDLASPPRPAVAVGGLNGEALSPHATAHPGSGAHAPSTPSTGG
ncbi:hypothetical protein J1605_007108, partial [Eschrichtius robustus]